MSRDVTSIEIKKSTWKELNRQKEPGDSFDDVVQRLLARPELDDRAVQDQEEDQPGAPQADEGLACPDCGEQFETFEELKDHMDETEFPH